MNLLDGQLINGLGGTGRFSDYEIANCEFDGCFVRGGSTPGAWNIFRNISLRNVTNINCSIDTAIFENVSLHNLKRNGSSPLFLWGCVFRHVTLSGKISGVKINRSVAIGSNATASNQQAWDTLVTQFYETVDWALDISEAKFAGGISFEAIPGNKIRRNPETQVLVTRQNLLEQEWRDLDYANSAFDLSLSWFLQNSIFDSVVLAARMDSKDAKKDLSVLTMLRERGLAT